ncbi:Heme oxygenase (staphylobilin-producing) 2 [bacterium HR17]|uniref:Heme oxygenase (Staphylobilin-producing) 2 n=1 Tax=Candidatus Fervidibacter japonicus TaxID=2035412 RepID=A0A2H5XBT3_9BACT|nr:Heme oxygenase (staphylobilin-producing) 2 [bacterium HR17]
MQWWTIAVLAALAIAIAVALQPNEPQPTEPQKDEPQFVTAFAVEVQEGCEREFIERFQKRARLIDKVKGYKGMYVLQHTQTANKFLVVTLWKDEASFRAWVNSEEFRKAHAEGGVPTKTMQLDTYRIVAK